MDWIKCSDQMPELNKMVLAYAITGYPWEKIRKKKICVGEWIKFIYVIEFIVDCGCSGYEFDREQLEITHWMPLPEPPKD